VYIFLLSSLILGRVGRFFPPASVSDWGFCSPGLNHGGDFEFIEFPATVEARCVCSTLIMGESTVVLFPWLEFALSWVAGCSSGMFFGDAISVVYLLAKGMDLICSPVSFSLCVGGSVVGARLLFRTLVSSSVKADRLPLFLNLDDDGQCAWEAVYSASMPGSKSSSAVSSTSWGSRRVAWASCSFGQCASSPTPADSKEVRCPGAMREDSRTLFLNLNGLRVLYANLHLWRMGMMDFIVNFFSSRVLVVKAGLL